MKNIHLNPHMTIMFLGLSLFFYHYYDASLLFNYYTRYYNLRNDNILVFIMILAPFTLSSIGCPIGGVLITFWQSKVRNYVFPYLFLFDCTLSIFSNLLINYIYLKPVLILALVCRALQGMLIGGLLPQYVIYFYAESRSVAQKVRYSTLFFIIFYICVILSIIMVNFTSARINSIVNWIITFGYLIVVLLIFNYKIVWQKFNIDGVCIDHSWSFIKTIISNRWTIIRFTGFITFMASINAFFLTVMPVFLTHYLNYSADNVFEMQIIIMIVGIVGFIFGYVYHASIGRKAHLAMGMVIKILMFILFKLYMRHNIYLIELIGSACLFCFGIMAAKILLIINSVFSTKARLHGVATTYNVSWGLMFGFSGFLTMHLIERFHDLYIPSLIIMLFSFISLISLWFTPDKDFFRYLE